jgi:hypothetical protein
LVILVVLAGAVLGGIVLDRTVLDHDGGSRFTEAQTGRLVHACEADLRAMEPEPDPFFCLTYVASMVEWAEGEGLSYVELAAEVELASDEEWCEREIPLGRSPVRLP